MAMIRTHCKAYREGWAGRRRNYLCRKCGERFQHDGYCLPVKARICPTCREDPVIMLEYQEAFA